MFRVNAHRRRLAAASLAIGIAVGLASAAKATQTSEAGALFPDRAGVVACAGDDVTVPVVMAADRFDGPVTLTAWSPDGTPLQVRGDGIVVHVQAGDVRIEAKAAGMHDGRPTEVADDVTVHGGC